MKISVEQTPNQKLSQYVVDSVDAVSIVHLPGTHLSNTITAIEKLQRQNQSINIIPHIAARTLKNKKELYNNCEAFRDLGIKDILLIGGSRPTGNCYGDIRGAYDDIVKKEYGFNLLCGVYPQHETPKQISTKKYDKFSRGISQICLNLRLINKFDSKTIVGVPSNCSASALLKFIKLCGITRTAREALPNIAGLKYLSRSGFNTAKFVSKLDGDRDIHIFNFGNLEKTVVSLEKLL